MNVKQWALFFVVTLSVNYVSATIPLLGGGRRGSRGGTRSYAGWNRCNRRMYYYLSENIRDVRGVIQSKFGGQCSLGSRELDNYSMRNIRGRGFGDISLGDTCQYNVEDGQAFIRFGISFERIVLSFFLEIEEEVGGLLGRLASTIIGIIGYFANQVLQIVFPSFLCNIVVVGDDREGFRLHDFRVLQPDGDLDFLGGLSGHFDILSSFTSILFEPLFFILNLFCTKHIKPILSSEIGDWECNRNLFKRWGLDLGSGVSGIGRGGSGLSGIGGGSDNEDSDEESSGTGGGSDDEDLDLGGSGGLGLGGSDGLDLGGSGGLGLGGKSGSRKSGRGLVKGKRNGGGGNKGLVRGVRPGDGEDRKTRGVKPDGGRRGGNGNNGDSGSGKGRGKVTGGGGQGGKYNIKRGNGGRNTGGGGYSGVAGKRKYSVTDGSEDDESANRDGYSYRYSYSSKYGGEDDEDAEEQEDDEEDY